MSAPAPVVSPVGTFRAISVSLSRERVAAYSLTADADSTDAVARYMWNLALGSAFVPLLHAVEVAFRNALYVAGRETTQAKALKFRRVPCWLDADPPLLEKREYEDVQEAIDRLGERRRQTPGHLVSFLGFGFWMRMCDRPCEQANRSGPQLWPKAAQRFPGCPKALRNRGDIRAAADTIRDWRNLVAHHQPIWDRSPLAAHTRALTFLGWMNRDLERIFNATSTVPSIVAAGHTAYRSTAASLVSVAR